MEFINSRAVTAMLLLAFTGLSLAGCSLFASDPQAAPKKPEVYKVAFRKTPPDPVYNPVRTGHLPQTMPSFLPPEPGQDYLEKNYKISVKDVNLEEVAKGIALVVSYSSYTASSLAKKKVSFKSYGTIDRVVGDLAAQVDAQVVLDHTNRELRILERSQELGDQPKFALQ